MEYQWPLSRQGHFDFPCLLLGVEICPSLKPTDFFYLLSNKYLSNTSSVPGTGDEAANKAAAASGLTLSK